MLLTVVGGGGAASSLRVYIVLCLYRVSLGIRVLSALERNHRTAGRQGSGDSVRQMCGTCNAALALAGADAGSRAVDTTRNDFR